MVQMALRYVISQPAVSVVIPRAKSLKQAVANTGAGSKVLSDNLITSLQLLT